MMDKLLPCPFCGGEAAVRDIKEPSVNGWIGCQRCRCFMDFVKSGKPQAIAAWNSRADAVPVVRGEWVVDECDTTDDVPNSSWIDFHCSECNTDYSLEEGQYGWCRYGKIPYQYCPNCGAKMEDKS